MLEKPESGKTAAGTNILFAGLVLLIVMQFAELVVALRFVEIGRIGSTVSTAWLFIGATALGIIVLMLGARLLVWREAARAEAIAEHCRDGILFLEGGRVVFANALARQLLSSNSTETLRSLEDASKGSIPAHYDACIDGSHRHFLVSKIELPNSRGSRDERQVFLFQDVTFLRENEEAKVNFIGTLSHEIKTPITSLSMAIAMLERSGFDAELLRIANADVSRLRTLLDDLLNISKLKIVHNPNQIMRRETNITALVQQTVKAAAPQAAAKGVRLLAKVRSRTPLVSNIDPTKISWALTTLLTDAVRQTSATHSVVIDLDTQVVSERLQAVFSIYYDRRLDALGPTGHAIVRDIIEAHDGRFITLHGADQRSVFRFSIHAYPKEPRSTTIAGSNNETNLTG